MFIATCLYVVVTSLDRHRFVYYHGGKVDYILVKLKLHHVMLGKISSVMKGRLKMNKQCELDVRLADYGNKCILL